jgi:hypothetical protein
MPKSKAIFSPGGSGNALLEEMKAHAGAGKFR